MEFFVQPCPPALAPLQAFVRPYAEQLGFPTLPLHIHHVLGAFLGYQLTYMALSPILTKLVLPQLYSKFSRRTQINWDVHVVSFVQSTFICALALWIMKNDEERHVRGIDDPDTDAAMVYRMFGYTVPGGAVQGYATGYFLWDLVISVYHIDIMGMGYPADSQSPSTESSYRKIRRLDDLVRLK